MLLQFFFRDQYLWPAVVKWVFLVFLASWIVAKMRAALTSGGPARGVWAALSIAGFLLAPFALIALRIHDTSHHYTALVGLSPVYAVVCTDAWASSRGRHRDLLTPAGVYLLFSFALWDNAAGFAVLANNERDLHTTARIVDAVREASDGQASSVHTIGWLANENIVPFNHPNPPPLNTTLVECSIYVCKPMFFPYAVRMLELPADGIHYTYLQTAEDAKHALRDVDGQRLATAVDRSGIWPDPASVLWFPETKTAIVVLSDSGRQLLR